MSVAAKKSQYRAMREAAQRQEHHSITYWCVVAFAISFLCIAPFQTALFYGPGMIFENPIYSSIVWTSAFSLLAAVYLFKSWRLREVRDVYALAVWCVPLGYLLSLGSAATRYHAENLLLLQLMYAMFFLIGLYFARNRIGNSVIRHGIVGSSYAVVGYCLMNMFGNAYFHDAVMRTGDGVRLTSVFQYANAYAGFLIIPLLCGLYLIVLSRKWYVTAAHALMLVPVLLSFFLTLSRGGLVMLPFILIAFLPFLSLARQLLFFVYLAVGSAASLLIVDSVRNRTLDIAAVMAERRSPDGGVRDTLSLFDPLSFGGWGLLLATSIVVCAAIVLLHKLLSPWLDNRLSRIAGARFASLYVPGLVLLGVVLGAALIAGNTAVAGLLPEALAERVRAINLNQHSVLERLTMYRDTFKALADYPLFGAGGNAWSVLYPQYANNPYTVNQVHSFFLQYMVETGLVGLAMLLAFVGSIFYLFAKTYFAAKPADRESNLVFYAVAMAILIHSLMDFEMSYAYVAALVFLSLGGMASGFTRPLSARWTESKAEKSKYVLPVALLLISAALLTASAVRMYASRLFTDALQLAEQGKTLGEVLVPLDRAIELQPNNTNYVLAKNDFLMHVYENTRNAAYSEESSRLLDSLRQVEPYDRAVFEARYRHYLSHNRLADALALVKEGLRHYPWVISMYERAASLHLELGEEFRQTGRKDEMNRHWTAVLELHGEVLARMKKLESLPEGQMAGDPFYVTPGFALALGQTHYMLGNAASSVELLATTLDGQVEEAIRLTGTRWYLAALMKAGKPDQALYDRFTGQYPDEKRQIDAIVSMPLTS